MVSTGGWFCFLELFPSHFPLFLWLRYEHAPLPKATLFSSPWFSTQSPIPEGYLLSLLLCLGFLQEGIWLFPIRFFKPNQLKKFSLVFLESGVHLNRFSNLGELKNRENQYPLHSAGAWVGADSERERREGKKSNGHCITLGNNLCPWNIPS